MTAPRLTIVYAGCDVFPRTAGDPTGDADTFALYAVRQAVPVRGGGRALRDATADVFIGGSGGWWAGQKLFVSRCQQVSW